MRYVPFPLQGAGRKTLWRLAAIALAVALLAVVVDAAIIIHMAGTPMVGDGLYFIGLAKGMAAGRGYQLDRSFWPDKPHLSRSPLWPVVLTIPELLFPKAKEDAVLRFTGAAMHGIAAALLVGLTFQWTGSLLAGALGGLMLAVYLPASSLVETGCSEPAFLAVLSVGIILLGEGGKWAWGGILACGISTLGRSNFVLFPVLLFGLAAVFDHGAVRGRRNLRIWAAGCVLFAVFPGLWILRNYTVSGAFPVLNTQEGETLYGGNNVRVASELPAWGYWVMPNDIPGEKTKQELARTRSELELDRYYHARAIEFIRGHLAEMPRLLLGKLVRGFVPVPWVPLAASYAAFFCRACVYAAFIAALFLWRGWKKEYALLLWTMFLITLATTLIYWGNYRFTFCLEPFLFPAIAGCAAAAVRGRFAGKGRFAVAVAGGAR